MKIAAAGNKQLSFAVTPQKAALHYSYIRPELKETCPANKDYIELISGLYFVGQSSHIANSHHSGAY